MPSDHPEIIVTSDGSSTAYSRRFEQAYSSVHGARSQAETVFVRGTGTDRHPAPRVLEVGFGLGHNFRATLNSLPEGASLTYLAYEFDPVPRAVLEGLDEPAHPVWQEVVSGWGGELSVRSGGVSLDVRVEDVTAAEFPRDWATAVYLDGFSPRANPDVWTEVMCARLADAMAPGGVLATYSAAGHVRRALGAAGLAVEKRRGLHGKREFVVAVKP